jgi:hypothetical protein
MRPKLFAGGFLFFVLVAVSLIAVLYGSALLSGLSAQGKSLSSSTSTPTADNKIVRENALPGTTSWQIPSSKQATTQIQSYANATSVIAGQKLSFYVSTQKEGTPYWISIYRLGWYNGYGGRLIATSNEQIGQAQGYYDESTHQLIDCTSCLVDASTGLVEARWKVSYTVTVPSSWTTGVYLAKFTDANGLQTYTPFDVRDNDKSTYIVATPDATYAAYNDWGGYSLYDVSNGLFNEGNAAGKGVMVSFDRPYTQESGSSQVLVFEADAIHWLERQGYDISYVSDIDLQQNPTLLLTHRAYLSLGHDEYWSKQMRDELDQARDAGIGLAFMGADTGYWQIRFAPDSAGVADRTVVCYKVETALNNLSLDPFYGKDNSQVTAPFRDPVINRPENALIGIMYDDLTHLQQGFPWQVSASANSPLLKGTSLLQGHSYGCDIVGYEWDHAFNNGSTPANLQVIATSSTINGSGVKTYSNTTYYIASSGAMVFASGSIYWTEALDSYRLNVDPLCANQNPVVPGIQQLMTNAMAALPVLHRNQQLVLAPATPQHTLPPVANAGLAGLAGLYEERNHA